jgi:hypothetical protein
MNNSETSPSPPLCRRCEIPMEPGHAIAPAHQTADDGTVTEAMWSNHAPLTAVWKCPMCGHSFTGGHHGSSCLTPSMNAGAVTPGEKGQDHE